jgi:hypothetical protein
MVAGGRVQVGQVQSRRRGIISISQFKLQCYNQWNHPSNWQHTQNRRDNPLQYSMLLQQVQPAARLQAQRIRYCSDILILSFVWTRLVGDGAPILLLQGPHRCVMTAIMFLSSVSTNKSRTDGRRNNRIYFMRYACDVTTTLSAYLLLCK